MAVDGAGSRLSRRGNNMRSTAARRLAVILAPCGVCISIQAAGLPAPEPFGSSKQGPLQSPVTLARDAVEVAASQDQSNVTLQLSRGDTGRELPASEKFPQ